jgi:hypothetical protein
MAKLKKEMLEGLTNSEIKEFFTTENWRDSPSPIKEYLEGGKDNFELGSRINRTERLLSSIIVGRFISGQL